MKIAIIGSNSFSGSSFIKFILEKTDYEIIGISRSPEYPSVMLPYKTIQSNKFKFFQLDINQDLDKIISLFQEEQIDYVVNFAAQGMVGQSWENPEHWFTTNTLGIVKLTNALRKLPIKKYIQISTPEVYGSCNNSDETTPYNPSSPYASSKASGDMFIKNLVKQYNFPAIFIRSSNVYGPCQQLFRIIPRSIIYMKLGKKISLQGGGKAIKSYIDIEDVCNGILKIIEKGKIGEVYHFSPDNGESIENIVRKICNKLGKDFQEVVEIVEERPGQDSEYILNSQKARTELEWKPLIELDQGLDRCIDWINKNWEEIKKLPLEYAHKE
jgi:dTDP-glucose 4,6-dehydratase